MGQSDDAGSPELVKCEITGKLVPPDEIIEIQGHRVCAEGKEELLQRLRSGEMMPGELDRPSVIHRFGCIFLDHIILGVPFVILMLAIVGTVMVQPDSKAEIIRNQGLVGFLVIVINVAYFTILHGTRGQTLGKMAGKIKVVNLDGSKLTMGSAFWRAILYVGPQIAVPFVQMGAPEAMGLSTALGGIGSVYALVNCICVLADSDKRRALHDRLAGTRVIKVS